MPLPAMSLCAVLTAPDRPAGRRGTPQPPPVKRRAAARGLPVLQPDRIGRSFSAALAALQPDLLVAVAYGKIFRPYFLDVFARGGVNVHPSLLPELRGPAPIPAAILAGMERTGVTVQRLAEAVDAGDILAQRALALRQSDTSASLAPRLARIGAELLREVVDAIAAGREAARPQDESAATWCGLLAKEQGRIDWRQPAAAIERAVRAYQPWPRAFTTWSGRQLTILAAALDEGGAAVSPRANRARWWPWTGGAASWYGPDNRRCGCRNCSSRARSRCSGWRSPTAIPALSVHGSVSSESGRRRPGRGGFLFTLAVSALLVASGLVAFFVVARGEEETLVPDVIAADLLDAMVRLQEKALAPRVEGRFSSDHAKWQVIEQDPQAGTLVKAGRPVLLVVSRGPIVDRVGHYVGRGLEEVRLELQTAFASYRALITIREPVARVTDPAPAGTILAQNPPADTPVVGEMQLELVVSKGAGRRSDRAGRLRGTARPGSAR